MTVQSLGGMNSGFWAPDFDPHNGAITHTALDSTMSAANESVEITGHIWLEGKTGTKKLSAAGGGSIWWMPGATITFANGTTNLRVGIQDPSTSGTPSRGNGTFDVYADLVGGTDTITALTYRDTAMETGTKDISHGQLVTFALTMTARGGADSVPVRNCANSGASTAITQLRPGVTRVTSGPTYTGQNSVPNFVIEFDDGTYGFMVGAFVSSTGALSTATAFNSGSTPDEHCNIFQVPGPVKVDMLWAVMNISGSSSSDYEMILYRDPLGTPVEIANGKVIIDASQTQGTAAIRLIQAGLTADISLSANTDYAIAIRPTTANNVSVYHFDVSAAGHWKAHSMGANCYKGTRSNQTGAFSATTTSRLYAGVRVCGIADDAGGGGGGMRMAGHGGLAA
jgi:hypothetical protein